MYSCFLLHLLDYKQEFRIKAEIGSSTSVALGDIVEILPKLGETLKEAEVDA